MKLLLIYLFTFNFFFGSFLHAQSKKELKLGVDILNPIIDLVSPESNSRYTVSGAFSIFNKTDVSIEVGFSQVKSKEDFFDFTTKGSFIKAGLDYNIYKNWKRINNEVLIGFRYNYSLFSQRLNNFTPNAQGPYFDGISHPGSTTNDNLNAHWISLVMGINVEVLKNISLGFSIYLNKLVNSKEPESFRNLYIPGFTKVYSNDLGVSFNYRVIYKIPFKSREK